MRADGACVDIHIDNGVIAEVSFAEVKNGTSRSQDHVASAPRGSRHEIDGTGSMVLHAAAEPHAHLDKALLAQRVPNKTEDLSGAVDAVVTAYETMDDDDVARRALAALRQALAHGYTAVRTHADCRVGIGTTSVRVLAELKERLAGTLDLQVVALAGPLTDPTDGANNRRLLIESLEAGADLVGGCPSLEPGCEASIWELLAIAGDFDCGIDVHIDETTDVNMLMLREMARQVIDSGFAGGVTASHCVSLALQDPTIITETSRLVAAAQIGVVTLPQTNLYLQAREYASAKPRGLTAIDTLVEAGVTVAAGGDNWRDPFNPMGRIDPMETASLMVTAGHQLVAEAYEAVSSRARSIMGLNPVNIAEGNAADLLLIEGNTLSDAMAAASQNRTVIKAGRVVACTTVRSELSDLMHG